MDKTEKEWIWWKHGVIYHIYPLSYYDSNNDGKGDIQGIIQKLDYLASLGIDAIWLSPIFKSPLKDGGYDVSDYRQIDSVFGSMTDFMMLLQEAHARNIKVILDMILNHTSSQHPWFQESKSNAINPKRDWYIWESGKKNKKPNNWKTAFGGSCWEFDQTTQSYYLHSFLKEQPDLNWRNKEVRNEMFSNIQFWLEKGVDGFRFDVINYIVKDKKLRNNPRFFLFPNNQKIRTRNHRKSFKIVRQLRKILDQFPDCTSIGEIYALPPGDPELAASYLSDGNSSLHMAFDFSMFFLHWNARKYYKAIKKWQHSLHEDAWPCNVFSNHDLFRAYNRIGTGTNRSQKARLLALMLFSLKGTPFLYYGDEIGMKNTYIPYSKIQDPLGKKYWPLFSGRDRARTPMQWNSLPNAGFSTIRPWLPVNSNYARVNVEHQQKNSESLLQVYKDLISLRKEHISLREGEWIPEIKGKNGILSYRRKSMDEELRIIINFSSIHQQFAKRIKSTDSVIFSTHSNSLCKSGMEDNIIMPFEGILVHIKARLAAK